VKTQRVDLKTSGGVLQAAIYVVSGDMTFSDQSIGPVTLTDLVLGTSPRLNNTPLQWKDTGGTARDVLNLNASNYTILHAGPSTGLKIQTSDGLADLLLIDAVAQTFLHSQTLAATTDLSRDKFTLNYLHNIDSTGGNYFNRGHVVLVENSNGKATSGLIYTTGAIFAGDAGDRITGVLGIGADVTSSTNSSTYGIGVLGVGDNNTGDIANCAGIVAATATSPTDETALAWASLPLGQWGLVAVDDSIAMSDWYLGTTNVLTHAATSIRIDPNTAGAGTLYLGGVGDGDAVILEGGTLGTAQGNGNELIDIGNLSAGRVGLQNANLDLQSNGFQQIIFSGAGTPTKTINAFSSSGDTMFYVVNTDGTYVAHLEVEGYILSEQGEFRSNGNLSLVADADAGGAGTGTVTIKSGTTTLATLDASGNLVVPQSITAQNGDLICGIDDLVRGDLILYGNNGGNGGRIRQYNGAGDDGTYEYFVMEAKDGSWRFGTDVDTGLFRIYGDGDAELFSGDFIALGGFSTNGDLAITNDVDAGGAGTGTTNFKSGTTQQASLDSSGNMIVEGNVSVKGDLLFPTSGGGMSFAGISAKNNVTATTITTANTYVQFTGFDTDDAANNLTPDYTNAHITVDTAGFYEISAAISASSLGGTAYTINVQIMINNGASTFNNLHSHRRLSGGGTDSGFLAIGPSAVSLSASDTVELWVENQTNTNDVLFENVALYVKKVGA
jgi:hypothetical protein